MDEHKPETLTMMDSSSSTHTQNEESTSASQAANNGHANHTAATSELLPNSAEHVELQTNKENSEMRPYE